MARGTGAVSAASVIEMDAEVQSDIEQRFLLAMVFVRQLAVLEGHCLAFGKERDFDGVLSGSIDCGGSGSLRFFFHKRSPIQNLLLPSDARRVDHLRDRHSYRPSPCP